MYKIIFIDLDGTLLNSQKEISDYTAKILQKMKGTAEIVLTSGRNYKLIKPYLETLNIQNIGHTICHNGACIVDNKTKEIILDEYIEPTHLQMLKDWVHTKNLNNVYIRAFTNSYKLDDTINEKAYKLVIRDDIQVIDKLTEKLPNQIYNYFSTFRSEYEVFDFNKKGVSKKNAIQKLLSILGIDKTEAIAFGDAENDIEMLQFVELGIAMGNAFESVKQTAKMIADTNDNDGVAKALIKIFDLRI